MLLMIAVDPAGCGKILARLRLGPPRSRIGAGKDLETPLDVAHGVVVLVEFLLIIATEPLA